MTCHRPAAPLPNGSPSRRLRPGGRAVTQAVAPVLIAVLAATLLAQAGCAPQPGALRPAPGGETAASTAAAFPVARPDTANDPLAAELAVYLRLLEPNGGSADELASFIAAHPDWPNRAALNRRFDAALAAETDPAVLARLCPKAPLASAAVLLRCTGPAYAAAARRAWINGIDGAQSERSFLSVWSGVLTPDDQLARFRRQEAAGSLDAASRTALSLSPSERGLANAEIALRRNDPAAGQLAVALPPDQQSDPELVLDLARWLRKNNRLDEALVLWRGRGAGAEAAALPALKSSLWSEREALARSLLDAGRDADALAMATDPSDLPAGSRADADFLSGWIELRRLHDPVRAQPLFEKLAGSDSVITRTRGLYWTARARAARNDPEGAAAWFSRAAAFPTTFYGQLAIARLDPADPQTLVDPSLNVPLLRSAMAAFPAPGWSGAEAVRFASATFARAAELLVSWNDPRHARAFLLLLDQNSHTDAEHAMGAALANRLGLPDVAVAIARSAGRHGLVLPASGWPRPFDPPANGPVPAALVLAVMRQESSFDPHIVSPAGAIGLMQITPGSAQDIARGLGRPDLGERSGLYESGTNMTLGSAFLGTLLARFGGVEPYALSGYNAGPRRAERWIAQYGDPVHGAAPDAAGPENDTQSRLLDWIETIPFGETRNYVERVMENQGVYNEPAR
ncbi:transglycosylase SLT domain-containing protein [Acetobacteraceae bacterium KSS8]|uniref:Transglycosylase SLT domain-containing protein n=1 Tax=Endosaccharibacter trunci TaxID=2812733 RepID=A0ABT1W5B7_9PROT|nr:transglycosylase SLT domain-containing protein [Acetobacteraceae bacterium KSS8]